MKSGLEGRNNRYIFVIITGNVIVSMKSGLEGRNNTVSSMPAGGSYARLNEVRPRRPEQFTDADP